MPPPPGMMASVLAKQLDLSDIQRAQVETITSARRQKLGSLGTNSNANGIGAR